MQIELPISMGNWRNYCEQYTRASSGEMPKVIKPSNPFTNVCWVSVLTTFSAPPQILAASTVFFCPISRNEEMMGDGFWCYCRRFVLNSKRLLSTSCNKYSSAEASSIFFMVLFLMLFEVRRIVCVEKIKQTLNNELKFHIVNIY